MPFLRQDGSLVDGERIIVPGDIPGGNYTGSPLAPDEFTTEELAAAARATGVPFPMPHEAGEDEPDFAPVLPRVCRMTRTLGPRSPLAGSYSPAPDGVSVGTSATFGGIAWSGAALRFLFFEIGTT